MGRKLIVVPVDRQDEQIVETEESILVREDVTGVLNLVSKNLTEIDQSVCKLVHLTELCCSNNQLTVLPDTIGNLVNLTQLFCNNNQLTALSDTIGNLVNLTELYCSNNQLTALPDTIGNLVNLMELDCSNNQLTALPDTIDNLVNLTELDCSNNQLTALPDTIDNLVNLAELYCSNNQLTALSDTIANLVNMTVLVCNNNQLTALPDTINLVNLTALDCSNNQLTALPDTIGNLVNLTELYCSNNQITALSDTIDNLVNLTKLWCNNNQLAVLPDTIGKLVNMTVLKCSNNQLTALSDTIDKLINLMVLECSNNQLTTLPDTIGNLVNLTKLDCRSNQLTVLPDTIGNRVNMTELWCSNNQLTALPDTIGNLVKLTELYCSNNQLTTLPDTIGNLVNLTLLECNNKQLAALPDAIGKLKNLMHLQSSHSILEAVSTFQTNQVWEINKFGEVTKKTSTDTAICPPHGKLLVSTRFPGTLDFSKARLSQIPESVFQLKCVSKLVLSDSTFTEILEDIELCQNLQELDVSNNDVLKSFPDNLWKCEKLRLVRTKGCQYAIQMLKSLTKSVETSKESRKKVLDDLEFVNVEKLKYLEGESAIRKNWAYLQRTGKPPPFSSLPKEKLMKWNSKPDVQFKLLIKFMICIVLLILSVYSMFVMSNDVCESPMPLSCELVCDAEALATQPQISAVQCLSTCTTQNYLRQVEMCGLPGASSPPERDDIHGIKVASIVLSMFLLLPHIVDVGNVMDQVLQIPFREKLYTILERHDRLSERVDGAGIIKYNVYGFLSSITNVLCCFQFGCFRPSKLKAKVARANLLATHKNPSLDEVETENPNEEVETVEEQVEILIGEPITKGYVQEEKPIDPLHTLEGVWLYDLESGKKLREMPSNVWGKLCGWTATLKGFANKCRPSHLCNSISTLPNRMLDCVKSLRRNRTDRTCKHQLQRACWVIHQKASYAVQRVSTRVKNIDRHWWMIVVVEWVDTVQTWSLFPLSYFVIMGSGSIGDVIVNVVAVSVYARLDDEAVEMFTRPQKSLLERWQLYTGSVEDLQNSGELGLIPREEKRSKVRKLFKMTRA